MKEIIVLGKSTDIVDLEDYRKDEIDLATLTGNVLWLEGDNRCFNSETQQWFERNSGTYFPPHGLPASFNIRDKFLRDVRANNDVISTASYYAYPVTKQNIVTEEMTSVFVIKKINKDAPVVFAAGRLANAGEDTAKKFLRLGVNASGLFTWWDSLSSTSYIQHSNPDLLASFNAGVSIIFTATSSKGVGCKLFLNGQLVGSSAREFTLTESTLYLDRGANCHRGHTMLFNTDLSKNQTQLDLLHSTLKTRYGIGV